MQDLTKIEKPIFLLDAETQARLKAHDGPIEVVGHSGWWAVNKSAWMPWLPERTYRAAPAPLTKPSINWDHVAPKWVAMATDGDGTAWLYAVRPVNDGHNWWRGNGSGCGFLDAFASFVPGTCDWRDSLVMRSGCEA